MASARSARRCRPAVHGTKKRSGFLAALGLSNDESATAGCGSRPIAHKVPPARSATDCVSAAKRASASTRTQLIEWLGGELAQSQLRSTPEPDVRVRKASKRRNKKGSETRRCRRPPFVATLLPSEDGRKPTKVFPLSSFLLIGGNTLALVFLFASRSAPLGVEGRRNPT